MTANAIKLSKFYALVFSEAKVLIEQVTWDKVPGQNKFRKFFLRKNWQDDIVSVSVSGSGAKGGAFYLEADTVDEEALAAAVNDLKRYEMIWNELVKDGLITQQGIKTAAGKAAGKNGALPAKLVYTNNQQAILEVLAEKTVQRQFVVKGTEEPGRILFAEYVLSRVCKAKIPKSLILEVDPSQPVGSATPSEGMIMLNLLGDPKKRNKRVDPQRFEQSYAYLDDGQGTPNSRVSYLVVQKLMKGRTLPTFDVINSEIADFLVQHKLRIAAASFAADDRFQNTAPKEIGKLVAELENIGCITKAGGGGIVTPDFETKLKGLTKLPKLQTAVKEILQASLDVLKVHELTFTLNSIEGQFDELDAAMSPSDDGEMARAFFALRAKQARYMKSLEDIVSSPKKMYNLGCVLFGDLPIGNGDRFENMNAGNFFFTDKKTTVPGKVNDPIGCIDNEAFLPTLCAPRSYKNAEGLQITEGFASIDNYVDQILAGTPELFGAAVLPEGYTLASSAALVQVMKVGKWFDTTFIVSFLTPNMPKCVLKQLSKNLLAPNDKSPFAKSKQLTAWTGAKQQIMQGFCDTLLEYQGIPLHAFRQVYSVLAKQYGKGINFDFLAYEVRHGYIGAAQVDSANLSIVLPGDDAITQIAADVKKKRGGTGVSRTIQQALDTAEADTVLKALGVEKDKLLDLLQMISIVDQEALIPCPFGAYVDMHGQWLPFGKMPAQMRQQVLQDWGNPDTTPAKYLVRINSVICAILARLYLSYTNEAHHSHFGHFFVLDSQAYDTALTDAYKFSQAELYRSGGGTKVKALRKDLLKKYNLPTKI
jgi:hypothetical protein